MTITTKEKVKSVLGITDTSKDERIDTLIPLVEGWIKGYCRNDFLVTTVDEVTGEETTTTVYPDGYELTAIRMVEFNLSNKVGKDSESMAGYSVQYSDDYPKSIIRGLKKGVVFA